MVTDINDNEPVCPEPPLFQVESQVTIEYVIGQLVVTDLDTGENAKITYSELRGDDVTNEATFLAVNRSTGEIYTIRSGISWWIERVK